MRFKKLLVGTVALAAIGALTGGALASSGGAKGSNKPVEVVSPTDGDNIQSGDQTTPDTTANGDNTRSNAQAAPDTSATNGNPAENPESSAESDSSSENSSESDGPGGHEDPPGQNVDHQFNGEE